MRTHGAILELSLFLAAHSLLTPGCGGDDSGDRVNASGTLADARAADPDAAGLDAAVDACGRVLTRSLLGPIDAAANDEAIYVVDSPPFEDQLRVHRIRRDTEAVDLLGTLGAPGGGLRVALAADDLFVYVAADIGLWRISTAGGEPEQLTRDPIDDLAQDATHLYWKTLNPGGDDDFGLELKRMAKQGGDEEILLDGAPGDLTVALEAQLAVDDTHLYWNDEVGDLRRMPKGGGEGQLFVDLVGPRGITTDLVHDGGAFYWFTRDAVEGDGGYDFFALRDGPDRHLARVPSGYVDPRLVVGGDRLYYSHIDADESGLFRVRIEGGDPERITGYAEAVVPTAEGVYVVIGLDVVLLPLEGCAG